MIRSMNYELFMGEALAEARQAAQRGLPAVGAVAVVNDAMVARASHRAGEGSDPTAHAVVTALRGAARKLGTPSLSDITIFTTLEPCPMCVGAMLECDVAALVYAVPNRVDGAAGTVIQLAQHPGLARRLEVVSGICRVEAEEFAGVRALTGT
jgi:tRNA(adenine34) deaminase